MKVGVFDSGMGGLILADAIARHLPDFDYVYFGDTARVPYGDRSQEAIYRFTRASVEVLFEEHDCKVIIIACNTASAEALRQLQQEFLPSHYPDRKILGVIIPTVECVGLEGPIGLLATRSAVRSGCFERELARVGNHAQIIPQAAPLLVPLIENGAMGMGIQILESYLEPLRHQGVKQLLLGCTHYGMAKERIDELMPGVKVWAQENIVPQKLADYFRRHTEIESHLSRGGTREYILTDLLDHYTDLAMELVGFRPNFQGHYLAI